MAQITTPAGITLEYETAGSETDPPLLMVSGFGAQLVAWPRRFCERLAAGGRFVISYDNRDCGLSSKLDGRLVDMDAINAAVAAGDFPRARSLAPYTLDEMADDGLALLDALGIERAHVLGASMGGMIAQTMAIGHPERTLTLTSMMSTTGEPGYGESSPEAIQALLTPTPERAGRLHRRVRTRADLALAALARRRRRPRDRGASRMTAATTPRDRAGNSPRSSPAGRARTGCAHCAFRRS